MSDKAGSADKAEKADKTDSADKEDKTDKAAKAAKADQSDQSDQLSKAAGSDSDESAAQSNDEQVVTQSVEGEGEGAAERAAGGTIVAQVVGGDGSNVVSAVAEVVGGETAGAGESAMAGASGAMGSQTVATLRVVNCNEWISLRSAPDTSATRLATVPLGATLSYVGDAGNGFYEVVYQGMGGYALSDYLIFDGGAAVAAGTNGLICWGDSVYTFDNMETDINKLVELYPDLVRRGSVGTSVDNRSLWQLTIGPDTARYHVLVFASIHGREYITTPVVMRQVSTLLEGLAGGTGDYKGKGYTELMADTAVHVVPMINPDGVSISQFGPDGIRDPDLRQNLYNIQALDGGVGTANYFLRWKSNARGVDLNRNYDARWETYNDRTGHPSSDLYKGEAFHSEPESIALVDLTLRWRFDRAISYHAQGQVIYWYFPEEGDMKSKCQSLAKELGAVTGYTLDAAYESLDPAGYKDWAISKAQVPCVTIEVGSGVCPLPQSQLAGIWNRNKDVIPATLYELMVNR